MLGMPAVGFGVSALELMASYILVLCLPEYLPATTVIHGLAAW